MGKRKIKIDDLLEIQALNAPQLSPDGRLVLFTIQTVDVAANRYRSHLWVVELASGSARQFTHGPVRDAAPRWSPNGSQIAFLRTQEKATHLWLMPADGGEAFQLDSLEEGDLGAPWWSPAGDQIAFTFRPTHPDWTRRAAAEREKRGLSKPPRVITRYRYKAEGLGFIPLRQHLWVCDVSTGDARPLTGGEFDAESPTWSPDGAWIAFLANRSEEPDKEPYRSNLWLVPSAGGPLAEVTLPNGYKRDLSWSPDGRHIAYIGSQTTKDPYLELNGALWLVPLDPPSGRAPRRLNIGLDRYVGRATISDVGEAEDQGRALLWSADSRTLFFLISDHGDTHLYRAAIEGEEPPSPVVAGELDVRAFSANGDGETVVVLASRPTQPGELYLARRHAAGLAPLTRVNAPLLDPIALSEPRPFRTASPDGQEVRGWVLSPPDFDPEQQYPALLYIHGGPNGQYGNTFFHEFQVLAARGMVVVYANPRGSLGAEESFATCIEGDWGGLDYQDLMAVADYAAGLPYVDPERMAVAGGSYGGYMTAWIIGHTDRFRCAIAERGSYNNHSDAGTTDWPAMPDGYWPGNPWDRPETLWEQSPLRFAAHMRTPLLLIHSEGDLRCPFEQAEQLFTALKWLNREVVFVRYPAETNHGLSRSGPPDLRLDRLQRITAWLAEHL